MKAVLISIQPKWCEMIASGRKTIEVRKTRPKIETPFKCYIYQTKRETELKHFDQDSNKLNDFLILRKCGKVIGEFVCDRIEEIKAANAIQAYYNNREETCLNDTELRLYLGENTGYGWHISDLKIYDKPKELRGFYKPCPFNEDCDILCPYAEGEYHGDGINGDVEFVGCGNWLTRPPQSWCYVEES